MSPLPKFPRVPRISKFIHDNNPARQVVEDIRESIAGFRDGITEVASAVRVDSIFEESEESAPPVPSTDTPVDATPGVTVDEPVVESGVTDAETLQYQKESLIDELTVLEGHLASGGKIMGKSCDCQSKHARLVKKLAVETVPIAARQGKDAKIYTELADWAKQIQDIGTKEAVDSGQYTDRYTVESGNASKFRKAIEAEKPCALCSAVKSLPDFKKARSG